MIISVVATRPNFIKMAPVIEQLKINKINNFFVHTGQHYDDNMSDYFFEDLMLPTPDHFMNIKSGSHAEQTAEVIVKFEKLCLKLKPKLIIVAGDVNSTLSCALAAVKLNIPIAHIESGLRSFDPKMPEEVNRILTDQISDLLFVTEKSAIKNLENENVPSDKIYFVGNCMIDSLIKNKLKIIENLAVKKYNLEQKDFCMVTLHRPSNVDNRNNLLKLVELLHQISKICEVVFPIHPRTKKMLSRFQINLSKDIKLLDPLSYFEFLKLVSNSKFVLTDSGGIQEETTYLGIQCITLRKNTERPITVQEGTNKVVGTDKENIIIEINNVLGSKISKEAKIKYWDGETSNRIFQILFD